MKVYLAEGMIHYLMGGGLITVIPAVTVASTSHSFTRGDDTVALHLRWMVRAGIVAALRDLPQAIGSDGGSDSARQNLLRNRQQDHGIFGERRLARFTVDAVLDFEFLGHSRHRIAAEGVAVAG